MEFIISSAALLKGTMEVSKALPAKTPPTAILDNFLFVLKDGRLEITASDQEVTLRTTIDVENSTQDGRMAVPAKQMMELLKSLPDQPVTIRTDNPEAKEGSFKCNWSNGNSSLPYFSADDYPEIPAVGEGALEAAFPAGSLAQAISSTIYATAEDEMRPAMNGIFFDIDVDSTTLVATDSHKLVCYTLPEVKAGEKCSFILFKRYAAVLRSSLDRSEGDVLVRFDGKMAVFTTGNTMMVCRLIVGKFPDYRRVIPQNNANVLCIDRAMLLDTTRRIAVCANKASNHVKLTLSPNELVVTAEDTGFALAAYEKLDCSYNGDNLSIGFKSPFLVDMLSNMNCTSIVMKFADSYRAALVVPAPEEEESGRICCILMPIKVS